MTMALGARSVPILNLFLVLASCFGTPAFVAAQVRVDYVEPSTARAGVVNYRIIFGKNLGSKHVSYARVVPAEGIPDFVGVVSQELKTAQPTVYGLFKDDLKLDAATKSGEQRGIQFNLPDGSLPGEYWVQLLDSDGAVLASSPIFVTGKRMESSGTDKPDAGKTGAPYTVCENGNSGNTLANPTATAPPVFCSYSVMSADEAKDNFGGHVSKIYYAIQVGVQNNDPQFDFLLRTTVLTLPDGRRVASRIKKFAQGVAVEGRIHDPRNMIYNAINWGGSIFGGFTIFSFAPGTAKDIANLVQGAGLTGFNSMFPDVSVENVNRFNNAVFDDSQALVVPKKGVAQPSLYIVALVPRPKGNYNKAYLERYGQQISVFVEGTYIQPVNLVNIAPNALAFDPQLVGKTSATQDISFFNPNQTPITITYQQPSEFPVASECGNSVAAQKTCKFSVSFSPSGVGERKATLLLAGNFNGSPFPITLSGTGTILNLNPARVTFDSLAVGDSKAATVNLENRDASKSVVVAKLDITGSNGADFTLSAPSDTCRKAPNFGLPFTIDATRTCNIAISFKPTEVGQRSASLNIIDDHGGTVGSVTLSGLGKLNPKLSRVPSDESVIVAPGSTSIDFKVEGQPGKPTPGGKVSYAIDSDTPHDVDLANGGAKAQFAVSVGTHKLTASYVGDSNYQTGQFPALQLIVPGPASKLSVSDLQGKVQVGASENITITAIDAAGNVAIGFVGSVNLTSTDSTATIAPAIYTFTPADQGKHVFMVTFKTPGNQTVTASSAQLTSAVASTSVQP